jgi:hypothetical protein
MVAKADNLDNVLANLRWSPKEDEGTPMIIRRCAVVVAALTLFAVAPSAKAATSPVTVARLDVSVTTTSDWTQVVLSPGRFAAGTVTANSGATTATVNGSTVTVKGAAGATKRGTVRVLFEETTLADPVTAYVLKGAAGATSATVTNVSTAPFAVGTITDNLHQAGNNLVARSWSRPALLGTVQPALPHADARRLTLAFWYPWWTERSLAGATLTDRPVDDGTTWSAADVDGATAQARANGIDGFVVSWAGEAKNGTPFDLALDAAARTDGYVAPLVEVPTSAPVGGTADPAVVRTWIQEALERSSSPAFLRSGGDPVVFVYGMDAFGAATWQRLLDGLAASGTRVRLVGDSGSQAGRALSWGTYRYSTLATDANVADWDADRMVEARAAAAIGTGPAHLFAATVMPGFDDRNLRGDDRPVLDRDGGATYDRQWDRAVGSDPDWVLVTSWNEWYEGTSVQPGVAAGDQALRQTATHAAAFRAG